jgi:hypothetical protein
MTEEKPESGPTLVEKWIRDQQEWQKTAMEYFDSMVKNDEFLVHLGNAMRGSLLAGKPYPGTAPPRAATPGADAPEGQATAAAAADDRIDELLHLLHRLEGEIADIRMTVEDLAARIPDPPAPANPPPNPPAGDSRRGGA